MTRVQKPLCVNLLIAAEIGAVSFCQALVQVHHRLCNRFPGESLHGLLCFESHSRAKRCIPDQSVDRLREGIGIAERHEQPGNLILDRERQPADVRCDHRYPAGHCLDCNQAK